MTHTVCLKCLMEMKAFEHNSHQMSDCMKKGIKPHEHLAGMGCQAASSMRLHYYLSEQ
jgi:hypothetical protein